MAHERIRAQYQRNLAALERVMARTQAGKRTSYTVEQITELVSDYRRICAMDDAALLSHISAPIPIDGRAQDI